MIVNSNHIGADIVRQVRKPSKSSVAEICILTRHRHREAKVSGESLFMKTAHRKSTATSHASESIRWGGFKDYRPSRFHARETTNTTDRSYVGCTFNNNVDCAYA